MYKRYTAWDLKNGVTGGRYTVREVETGKHTGRYATYQEAQEAAHEAEAEANYQIDTDEEIEGNGCPECERSYGPNFTAPCTEH